MVSWLLVCGACAVLIGAGYGLLALLVRHTALYAPERWALRFLLGSAAMSLVWIAGSPLYDRLSPVWVVSLSAASLIVWAGFRRTDLAPAQDLTRRHWADAALAFLLATQILVLFVAAVRAPLGWDGLFNFEMKARLAFEHTPSGQYPLAYLSDASRAWSHPEYPLLVPFAEWWIYAWLGRVDQLAVKVLFPLFYLSAIGLLWGAVRRSAGARAASVTAVLAGLLPPLTLLPGAVSGYADVPLTAAVVGACSFTWLGVKTRSGEILVLAGALGAVAAWTKMEGLLLAACIGVPAVAVMWSMRGEPAAAGVARWQMTAPVWLPMAVAIPWLVIGEVYGMPPADLAALSVDVVARRLDQNAVLASMMARELVRPGHWGLIWPAWSVVVASMLVCRTWRAVDLVLVVPVLLALAAYVGVFTVSAWADPAEQASWALPRLLAPLAPIGLIFIVDRLSVDLAETTA